MNVEIFYDYSEKSTKIRLEDPIKFEANGTAYEVPARIHL